jgi:SAM-dependent methyltransferase
MDTEEWWTTYHQQHADFREWILAGSELADSVGAVLADAARAVPGGQGRVLHIGCGSSILHEDLMRSGFRSVVNIDFSEEIVDRMRTKFAKIADTVSFVVADARDLAPADFGGPESFDCVVGKGLFDCLLSHGSEQHKVSNCVRALRGIRTLLRPGAVLVETSMFAPPQRLPYLQSEGLFSVHTLVIELNPLEMPHQQFSYIYVLTPSTNARAAASTAPGPADAAGIVADDSQAQRANYDARQSTEAGTSVQCGAAPSVTSEVRKRSSAPPGHVAFTSNEELVPEEASPPLAPVLATANSVKLTEGGCGR